MRREREECSVFLQTHCQKKKKKKKVGKRWSERQEVFLGQGVTGFFLDPVFDPHWLHRRAAGSVSAFWPCVVPQPWGDHSLPILASASPSCWDSVGLSLTSLRCLAFTALESCFLTAFLSTYNSTHHVKELCQSQNKVKPKNTDQTNKQKPRIPIEIGPSYKKMGYATSRGGEIPLWYY